MAGKRDSKTEAVQKPYLTGSPVDGGTWKNALAFFGGLVVMAFLNLILTGTLAAIGGTVVGALLCGVQQVLYYAIFAWQGLSKGTQAVTLGEIQYRRQEEGRSVDPEELRRCFHPLKGWLCALLGTLPLLIVAVLYAFMARPQSYPVGSLPSWVTSMSSRPDVLLPLSAYTTPAPARMADYLRVIVRAELMPWVCIVGSGDFSGMLLLERLSPLLVLFPAAAYGVGYMRGVKARSRTHTDIAANREKKRKREQQRKRREAAQRQTERLN